MTEINFQRLGEHLDDLIDQQNKKVNDLALRIIPHLTPEDLLNPQDYEELRNNPHFNYEDGYLSGLKSVQISLRQLRQ